MRLRLATIVVSLATGCGNDTHDDAAAPLGHDHSVTSETAPIPRDIPEPITAEEVAAMDLAEAQEVYARLSVALQQARVEDETRKRLWDEWRMVRDRVRDIKTGDGT